MHWQRLDRDNSVKVIDSVKSDANAGLFSVGTSEVKRANLPFYEGYFLYQVTNYASLPSFSFQYLGDGTFFQYLDGTESPIHAVNDKGILTLNQHNIMNYLDFYFSHVSDEEGDIIVIHNPHDMPLLDSLDADAYNAVFSQHTPAQINHNDSNNSFEIDTDLYKESQLVRGKITVTSKGRVSIKDEKMIMHTVVNPGFTDSMM